MCDGSGCAPTLQSQIFRQHKSIHNIKITNSTCQLKNYLNLFEHGISSIAINIHTILPTQVIENNQDFTRDGLIMRFYGFGGTIFMKFHQVYTDQTTQHMSVSRCTPQWE